MSKNNEVKETEVIEEINDSMEPEVYEMEPEEESGIGLGKIAIGTALVVGGIGLLCYKFRDKIDEHRVKKLEKKGYTVIQPETYDDEFIDSEIIDNIENHEEESENK